jgi:hypothetical protein
MTGRRNLLLLASIHVATGGLAAQVSAPEGSAFDYRTRVGITGGIHGRLCLAIQAPHLAAGSPIVLVWVPPVGERGQAKILLAETTARDSTVCPADSGPDFGEYGDSRYPVRLARGRPDSAAFYFGVLAPAEQFRIRGGAVVAALGENGRTTAFRACTSSEGIHLTVWSGNPLTGTRVWHRYVHFSYDTPVRCRVPDYRPPE